MDYAMILLYDLERKRALIFQLWVLQPLCREMIVDASYMHWHCAGIVGGVASLSPNTCRLSLGFVIGSKENDGQAINSHLMISVIALGPCVLAIVQSLLPQVRLFW